MAHAFIKPTYVVDSAIQYLQSSVVLPQLVWRNAFGDFAGKFNDTITVRVPAPTNANTRVLRGTGSARNLTASDLTEDSFPVTLTDDVYNLILLTDEEKTLDVPDFATQVLARQVDAVARKLENGLAQTIINAPYVNPQETTAANFFKAVLQARRRLNDAFVPEEGRIMIVGSAIEEAILGDERFIRYDSQGQSAVSALQDARIGRIFGFDVVRVPQPIPYGDCYIFHRTAFVLASRPPAPPTSGADRVGAVSAAGGFALRWLMDYDSTSTTDRSLVDTFVGYKAITDPNGIGFVRAQKIHLTATSVTITRDATALTAAAGPNHTRAYKAIDSNGDDVTSKVDWVSSDQTKATVTDGVGGGVVTGVAAGSTNITAVLPTPGGNVTSTAIAQTVV